MTDLETFVVAPGRADLVRQVRAKIDELGISMIYFQFCSVTGRIMGKAVPTPHWEDLAQSGIQFAYAAVSHVLYDRHGALYGNYPATMSELVAIPDPETFCQLPWNKRCARVFCTLFRNREEEIDPGAFLDADCRGNLRRVAEQFARDHDGLHMRLGCEPEMFWLKRGEDGRPAGGPTKPLPYHMDQFETLSELVLRVDDYARAMGLDTIQSDHEDGPGMIEQNWTFDDCLRTADRLTTYRQICARVAREFDLIACFMTKPFVGVTANGCHHNMSIWRGGKDEVIDMDFESLPGADGTFHYRQGGKNLFRNNSGGWPPSPLGLTMIGGIVAHLPALTAIGSSTVNSYRRLMDVGFWTPLQANWGYQNRTSALRISSPDRMEYRSVDSLVNPYLMTATLLKAIDDGITNRIDPGPPEQRDPSEFDPSEGSETLPRTLHEALLALENDAVVRGALTGDLYDIYTHYKHDEWERFLATVTEWDFDMYLDWLP